MKSGLAGLPATLSPRHLQGFALGLGVVCGVASLVVYDRSGYSHTMLYLWP